MRSKFAIWSDQQDILSPNHRTTKFAWARRAMVVCSVCGIAGASVYSQIGPDRATMATDRVSGYGAGARPQEQRTQSPETPSAVIIDAYARSGATTGAASLSSAGATAQSPAGLKQRPASAAPMPMAALPESTAKPARRLDDPGHASTSTAIAPEDAATAERSQQRRRTGSVADPVSSGNSRRDDAARKAATSASQEAAQPKSEPGDTAGAVAEAGADPDNKSARAGKPDEKWRGRRSARGGSTRSWTRDDNATVAPRDARDRNGFATFGPAPDARKGYAEFDSRDRRSGFAEFEPWDRRGRNNDMRDGRRHPSQSWPFNWFAMPF